MGVKLGARSPETPQKNILACHVYCMLEAFCCAGGVLFNLFSAVILNVLSLELFSIFNIWIVGCGKIAQWLTMLYIQAWKTRIQFPQPSCFLLLWPKPWPEVIYQRKGFIRLTFPGHSSSLREQELKQEFEAETKEGCSLPAHTQVHAQLASLAKGWCHLQWLPSSINQQSRQSPTDIPTGKYHQPIPQGRFLLSDDYGLCQVDN